MKIRYNLTYKCREHGLFTKVRYDLYESVECSKCHRLCELVEGTFHCVQEPKHIITKTQKKLEVI